MCLTRPLKLSDSEISEKYSLGTILVRPYGSVQSDLNIDFKTSNRPGLITLILQNCLSDENNNTINIEFFHELTIGKRIEMMFAVTTFGGAYTIPLEFKCRNTNCLETMEMNLDLSDVSSLQEVGDLDKSVEIEIDDKKINIRKPTGKDQQNWLGLYCSDESELTKKIVGSLIQNLDEKDKKNINEDMIAEIKEIMEEKDPLVNFGINTVCPYCESENYYELDLEELCLSKLKKIQGNLIISVHRLASHYNWREMDIFKIPVWRRNQYIELIGRDYK